MSNERTERISASLEAQFNICMKETDGYRALVQEKNGFISPGCFDTFLKLQRMNAQLAGTIARLDAMKNHNSKTQ